MFMLLNPGKSHAFVIDSWLGVTKLLQKEMLYPHLVDKPTTVSIISGQDERIQTTLNKQWPSIGRNPANHSHGRAHMAEPALRIQWGETGP